MAEMGQQVAGGGAPPTGTPRAERVVLAYSGGVDTSVCIPYLMREWGVKEVITFAADLGQGDELEPIRLKALRPAPAGRWWTISSIRSSATSPSQPSGPMPSMRAATPSPPPWPAP